MTITLETLTAALHLPNFDAVAAQKAMAPKPHARLNQFADVPAKQAGVLALLYPADSGLNIVLTRRQESLRGHAGQISFPGGKRDPEDESFTATALREAQEEIGIDPSAVQIIGQLAQFYVPPSNFDVYPTVGYLPYVPQFRPNPAEVAQMIIFPVTELLAPGATSSEYHDFQGMRVYIPFYQVAEHKIWGATAVVLCELAHRLQVARDSL